MVDTGGGVFGSGGQGRQIFGGGIWDGTQAGFGAYDQAAAGIGEVPFEQAAAGIGAWDRVESYKDGVFSDRNGKLHGELQSYREGSLGLGQMYEQAAAGIGSWDQIESYREGSLGLDGYGAGEQWLGGYGAGEEWLGALGAFAVPSCCAQLGPNVYQVIDRTTYNSILQGSDPAALKAMSDACCAALPSYTSTQSNVERNLDCSGRTGVTAEWLQNLTNDKLAADGTTFEYKGKELSEVSVDGMWGGQSCAGFCAAFGRAPNDGDLASARADFKDLGIKKCGGGQDIHVPSCSCAAVTPAPPPPPVVTEPPLPRPPVKKGFSAAWIVGGLLGAAAIAGIYAATKKKKAA